MTMDTRTQTTQPEQDTPEDPQAELKRDSVELQKSVMSALQTPTERIESIESPEYVKLNLNNMICIDGRTTNSEKFAGPGGALGFALTLLDAALKSNLIQDNEESITHFLNEVTQELGGQEGDRLTFHTDTHTDHHGENPAACAGCGHCNGILTNPEAYGLSPKTAEIVKKYIKVDASTDTSHIMTLPGNHNESGLIIFKGNPPQATMAGTTGVEDLGSNFIYHEDVWKENLATIGEQLFNKYNTDPAKKFIFLKQIELSYNHQLHTTGVALNIFNSDGTPNMPTAIIPAPDFNQIT